MKFSSNDLAQTAENLIPTGKVKVANPHIEVIRPVFLET